MQRGISDVVVHVARPLAEAERRGLEQSLAAEPGIRAVRGSAKARQLLIVDFDPVHISSLGVLRCLQALGLEARLVGM